MSEAEHHQKLKLRPRDIVVIILVVGSVVGAWFVLIAALLHLAAKGYAFYAWLLLLILTIVALKWKRQT